MYSYHTFLSPEICQSRLREVNLKFRIFQSPASTTEFCHILSTSNDFWLVDKAPRDQSGEASHFYFLVTYWTTKLTEHLRQQRKAVLPSSNKFYFYILSLNKCQNGKLLNCNFKPIDTLNVVLAYTQISITCNLF